MPFPDSYVQEAMGGIATRAGGKGSGGKGNATASSNNPPANTTPANTAPSSGTGFNATDQKWIDSLPPDEAVTSPCAESAAAREKDCEVVRRRTELQLEKVGCPSYVSPKYNLNGQINPNPNYGGGGGGGCGYQQPYQQPAGCGCGAPPQLSGGCTGGMCTRT